MKGKRAEKVSVFCNCTVNWIFLTDRAFVEAVPGARVNGAIRGRYPLLYCRSVRKITIFSINYQKQNPFPLLCLSKIPPPRKSTPRAVSVFSLHNAQTTLPRLKFIIFPLQ